MSGVLRVGSIRVRVGSLRVGSSRVDTNMLVSESLALGVLPNARGFALQWNIGLKVLQNGIEKHCYVLGRDGCDHNHI